MSDGPEYARDSDGIPIKINDYIWWEGDDDNNRGNPLKIAYMTYFGTGLDGEPIWTLYGENGEEADNTSVGTHHTSELDALAMTCDNIKNLIRQKDYSKAYRMLSDLKNTLEVM